MQTTLKPTQKSNILGLGKARDFSWLYFKICLSYKTDIWSCLKMWMVYMGQKAETSRYNVHFLLTIYHMDFECPLWLHKQITVNIYLNTAPLWQNTFEMLIFFLSWKFDLAIFMSICMAVTILNFPPQHLINYVRVFLCIESGLFIEILVSQIVL